MILISLWTFRGSFFSTAASRRPSVPTNLTTIASSSCTFLISNKSPFNTYRVSSWDTAKEVKQSIFFKTSCSKIIISLSLSSGNLGNSSLGNPINLNSQLPNWISTILFFFIVKFTWPKGSSLIISLNLLVGIVIAPGSMISASNIIEIPISKSVVVNLILFFAVSKRILDRIGRTFLGVMTLPTV